MKRHLLVTALAAAVLSTAAFAAAPADNGDMMMPRHGRHHDMDKKDFERMRADFLARVDTNKDGKISRSEAEANAPHLAVLFDAIDTNKDGQLTQEELDTFHKKMQEARDSERKHFLDARFTRLDTNKDGFISKAEARGDRFLERRFDQIDTNKDGKISRAEFAIATDGFGRQGGPRHGGPGFGPGF